MKIDVTLPILRRDYENTKFVSNDDCPIARVIKRYLKKRKLDREYSVDVVPGAFSLIPKSRRSKVIEGEIMGNRVLLNPKERWGNVPRGSNAVG